MNTVIVVVGSYAAIIAITALETIYLVVSYYDRKGRSHGPR